MRSRATLLGAVALATLGGVVSQAGCADILGIPDRYYDGAISSGDGPSLDAPPPDAPPPDGAPSACGSCTANGAGCEVLACEQDTPTAITVAGTNVYWANSALSGSNNAVMKTSVAGGTPSVAFPAGANELPSLATLNGDVYASTFTGGAIVWIPGNGSTPKAIDSVPYAQSIGVDAINGYLAYGSFGNTGGVYMCAPNPPTACTGYQAVKNQANVQGTAIDSSNVYWSTTTSTPGIYRCPFAVQCSAPLILVSDSSPTLVAVDGTHLYWIHDTFTAASIFVANKDGTLPSAVATVSSSILSMVSDGGYVYYAAIGDPVTKTGKIAKVKTDGTGAVDLVTGLVSAAGVAVDATHVYFTEWGGLGDAGGYTHGRVMRAPR